MPTEKSAGVVIFRREKDTIKYLLLHYPRGFRRTDSYWDFPKGHIEKGETEGRAMRREAFEETGIKDLILVPKFCEVIKYFFKFEGKNILKFVTFYLTETKTNDVKISGEHIGYQWLPYGEALEQLKFQNAKKILKKANDFLSKEGL